MFSGSIPALITPFKNGAVDIEALEGLVEWHIKEGSDGLVAVGTTGESPTLSHDEHKKVIEVVVKSSMGKVPVIAGAGSNNTSESVELIKFASKIGADHLAMSFYLSFQTPISIIRPFNTYGPRQSSRAVIPTIITQILSGKDEIMLGSLTPTRDFNYVDDVVEAFQDQSCLPILISHCISV